MQLPIREGHFFPRVSDKKVEVLFLAQAILDPSRVSDSSIMAWQRGERAFQTLARYKILEQSYWIFST